MDLPRFKDGRVHFGNSGVKENMKTQCSPGLLTLLTFDKKVSSVSISVSFCKSPFMARTRLEIYK